MRLGRAFTGPRLAGLSGAFSAAAPMNTFWGGATAGLAGSLGGAAQYAQNTHEQEKQMLQQMMEERRLALEQGRATEDARHNLATESATTAKAEPDWNVTTQGPDGEQVTGLPPYLQGVPPAARSDAAKQFYEKMYASQKPDPFSLFLQKEQYKADHPAQEDTSWIGSYARTTRSGKKFLDITELQGKDHAAAIHWAAQQGIPAIGGDSVSQLHDIDAARGNIDTMLGQLKSLLPKDPQGRVQAYPGIKLSQILQTNAQQAAFNTWRGAAIRNFRAVAGSKGLRLNQKEIDLAVKNDIPQITDTYEVAKAKMANVNSGLSNAESPLLQSDWGGGAAPQSQGGIVEWVRDPSGKLVQKGQ